MKTLRRYVVAASLARTADEGMAPALALLAIAKGRGAAFAGLLLAVAALPHVVAGPLAGALLDTARHRRALLALAPLVFGAALVAVALGLGRVADPVVLAVAVLAGCAGPLLAGGLSAALTELAPERASAPALDGASYNAAAIAGPAVVAVAAAVLGPEPAAIVLGGLAAAACVAVWTLPIAPGGAAGALSPDRVLAGARGLWAPPSLRRVTVGTSVAFVGAGALPLVVVARAAELGSARAGAALMAAMAVGALGGSMLAARPGDPERRVPAALLAVAVALATAALAPSLPLTAAALVAAGVADGILLPAVLAVRATWTAPGERGAVFTTAASAKIAAGAAGAGAAGLLVVAGGAAAALTAAAALHVLGGLLALRPRSVPAPAAAAP